ncbi:MAG: CDP-alcohol phosphatidyltransferase family protein [Chloroflexi bacterium]|nr:CDP-alcohol phosphatidyltransferase family protein [Chloroflexota bacterium]
MGKADSYSSIERRFLAPARGLLARVYGPLVRALARLGVSPNMVSLLGPALGLVFVYTVRHHLRLSFLIWVPSMLVDGIDGALARYTGRASNFGALMDQVADHTRETLIVVGLTAAGALSPLWGSLYPFVYTATNVTLLLGNQYGVPAPFAVKSWMVLYPAIAVYLLWGRNCLDAAAAISILFMMITVLYGLVLLKRGMDEGAV